MLEIMLLRRLVLPLLPGQPADPIRRRFQGRTAPRPPWPAGGVDPTADAIPFPDVEP